MKKKLIIIISIIIILLIICFFVFKDKFIKKEEVIEEYTPEQEISDEQLRETIVTLYFENTENKNLNPEARKIDANNLINNPYEYLINLLIEGPKNEKLKNIIPEGTKLKTVKLEGEILIIDFSKEFTNANMEEIDEENIINEILFTVSQLNEVNGIKILIDGEENKCFEDEKINFKEIFYLKENI